MVKAVEATQKKQTDIPTPESPTLAKSEESQNSAKQPEKSALLLLP